MTNQQSKILFHFNGAAWGIPEALASMPKWIDPVSTQEWNDAIVFLQQVDAIESSTLTKTGLVGHIYCYAYLFGIHFINLQGLPCRNYPEKTMLCLATSVWLLPASWGWTQLQCAPTEVGNYVSQFVLCFWKYKNVLLWNNMLYESTTYVYSIYQNLWTIYIIQKCTKRFISCDKL